jgi:hypothetical protein
VNHSTDCFELHAKATALQSNAAAVCDRASCAAVCSVNSCDKFCSFGQVSVGLVLLVCVLYLTWFHYVGKKCRQHLDFPGGHPPEYYPSLRLLNFAERTGYGVLSLRWPSTHVYVDGFNLIVHKYRQIPTDTGYFRKISSSDNNSHPAWGDRVWEIAFPMTCISKFTDVKNYRHVIYGLKL